MRDEPERPVTTVEQHGPRHRVMAAVAAFLTAAGLVAAVAVGWSSDPETPPAVEAAQQVGQEGVALTPDLPPRLTPTQVWTGDRLFVFGGRAPETGDWTLLDDGALVDVASGSTELLPPAPFDPPLYLPSAVATPGNVLVIGHSCKVIPESLGDSEPGCERSPVLRTGLVW